MAVVQKSATTLPDLSKSKTEVPDPRISHGVLRTSCHAVEIANGDSSGSTYEVARLPSHARLHRLSALRSTGVEGVGDADLGGEGGVDVLADGVGLTEAGAQPAISAVAAADVHKPLWQLLGHKKDPKTELSVVLTVNAAATSDGLVVADLIYIVE